MTNMPGRVVNFTVKYGDYSFRATSKYSAVALYYCRDIEVVGNIHDGGAVSDNQ
jgi:hypothetical protein